MQFQALAFGEGLIRLIWPPQCLICTTPVEAQGGLCPACWPQLPLITGAVCDSCGAPLPGQTDSTAQDRCDDCLRHPPPWHRGRAVFLYDGHARALVLQLKHGDRVDLARPLAARLALAAAPLLTDGPMLLVPVPLHRLRFFRRRYNQSALLARQLARRLDWPLCPDLLQRVRHTPSQDHMTRQARQSNLDQALQVTPRHRAGLAGQKILLIDDVMTTGATLSEACRCLQAAGSGAVCILTLARVTRPL